MAGLKNILEWINNNWTFIVVILGLLIGIAEKLRVYLKKSNAEKIEQAKNEISNIILKMITDAEEDYADWVKAGEIKRAQVIEQIFIQYPILSKVTDQKALIDWIDKIINEALTTLRDIISENKEATDNEENKTVVEK